MESNETYYAHVFRRYKTTEIDIEILGTSLDKMYTEVADGPRGRGGGEGMTKGKRRRTTQENMRRKVEKMIRFGHPLKPLVSKKKITVHRSNKKVK